MDFFSYIILKYIKRFFHFKKIFVLILIFLVLCFSFNVSFATEGDILTPIDATYFDANVTLNNIYNNIYANIIWRLENNSESRRKEVCNYFLNTIYTPYICFQHSGYPPSFPIGTTPINRQNMFIYFNRLYQDGSNTYTQTTEQVFWFGLANFTVAKRNYEVGTESFYYSSFNNSGFSVKTDFSDKVYLYDWYTKPLVLFDYPDFFSQYLLNIRDGVSNKDLLAEISAMGDNLENIDNEISKLNEFLQNEETTPITNDYFPSDDMQDVTSEGFDNVFRKLYNAFTIDDGVVGTRITIPYLNYTFIFYKDYLKNALLSSNMGAIIDLITAFYYFIVSRFIVKDIAKYIDDFKNGDISKTETNIKADML